MAVPSAGITPVYVENGPAHPHLIIMNTAAQQGRWNPAAQACRPAVDGSAGLLPDRGRVGVTRLVLNDFRNYTPARPGPRPGPGVLAGQNGAGRTHLL